LSASPQIGQLFREEKFYADNKCGTADWQNTVIENMTSDAAFDCD
jgi:hypothetical protein